MSRRIHLLIYLSCLILVIAAFLSCTQTEDIITSRSNTTLTMTPVRMFTPPAGMIYRLWAAGATDTVYIGQFSFNQETREFMAADSTVLSGTFTFAEDLYAKISSMGAIRPKFTHVLVSLDRMTDPTTSPGPIMLLDVVDDGTPVVLTFPESDTLWYATMKFNLEGVSDEIDGAGDGSGLWFCTYFNTTADFVDTTNLTPFVTDSVDLGELKLDPITGDTLNKDSLFSPKIFGYDNFRPDTSFIKFGADTIVYGVDSLQHISTKFDTVWGVDSVAPYKVPKLNFFPETQSNVVSLNIFVQAEYNLPNLDAYGWSYKGWVVAPEAVLPKSLGTMTPPPWPRDQVYDLVFQGTDGGMLTTGRFDEWNQPDMQNIFQDNGKVPPVPGEDFLNSTELMNVLGIGSVNLLPMPSGNTGTVFVTMEPDNLIDTTTNFPLFAFIGSLPSSQSAVAAPAYQFDMFNWTRQDGGNPVGTTHFGFPRIQVEVRTF